MFLFLQPTPTSGPSPNWGRGAGEGAFARMAELVDALVSGTSILKDVQVRVLFRAQRNFDNELYISKLSKFCFYIL